MKVTDIVKFVLLFLVAIGSGPAYTAIWQWSTTPANNATADPTINWAEGQSPSSVNDSARAMMARLAEFRDDNSGLIVDTGNSGAYQIATEEGIAAVPNNGQKLCFVPANTNITGVTLQADLGNTYPIQGPSGSGISAGSMVQGSPYCVTFNSSGSGSWQAMNFYATAPSTTNVPLGAVIPFTGTTPPNSNFVLPFGQAISRTTYASYFALVSTTYGTGDGVTTFNVVDMRGVTPFGLQNMGGTSNNNITVAGGNCDGTIVGNKCGSQNHTLLVAEMPSHTHTITDPGHVHAYGVAGQSYMGTGGFQSGTSGGNTYGNSSPNTASATTGITINNAGGGGFHTILSPAVILPYILRIN